MRQSFKSIFSLGVGKGLMETNLTQVFAYVLKNAPSYAEHLLTKSFNETNFVIDEVNTEVCRLGKTVHHAQLFLIEDVGHKGAAQPTS